MKFPGGGNMQQLLAQAQKMQTEMKQMQEKLAMKEFDTESAGGRIKVRVNGKQEILNLEINKELIDPEDPDMLSDLVKVAINDAITTSQNAVAQEMGQVVPPHLSGLF